MGKVVASASMSLDGYIAKADNTIGHLFDWFDNGDMEYRTVNPDITLHLNQQSFDYWQAWVSNIGALVCGRTLFDFTDGWDGQHTMDVNVVVVTHEPPAEWIAAHPGNYDPPTLFRHVRSEIIAMAPKRICRFNSARC